MQTQEQATDETTLDSAERWVRESLADRVEAVLQARREYWANQEDGRPGPDDVDRLIRRSALKNASVSGASTAVPGLIGLGTVPVEVVMSLNVMVGLVYDIALAHDQADQVDLATVLVAISDDTSLVSRLLQDDDGKSVVRRPTRAMMSKVSDALAKQAAKRMARLVLGRLVPVIGAAAAAWWARSNAMRVGRRANEMFGRELVVVDATPEDEAQLDAWASADTPEEIDASPQLLAAQYAVLSHVAGPLATGQQKAALTELYDSCVAAGVAVEPPDLNVQSTRALADVTVFAGRDPAEFFAAVAAFGDLGSGVDRSWAHEVGASFGLQPDAVDDLLEAEPTADQVWHDA